jgi:uncharacterized damage-inducible protein DinB
MAALGSSRPRCKLVWMNLVTHFQMLARYNRTANERLFAKCAHLDDAEYRKQRAGSFGSIQALLNHILLGDRRWIGLFEGGERVTSPINQILYDDFSALSVKLSSEVSRQTLLQRFCQLLTERLYEHSLRINREFVNFQSAVDAPAPSQTWAVES